MATSSKMEVLNSSTVRPFENDDYDYLINCTDLITTCQVRLAVNSIYFDNLKTFILFSFDLHFRKHFRRTTLRQISANRIIRSNLKKTVQSFLLCVTTAMSTSHFGRLRLPPPVVLDCLLKRIHHSNTATR